MRTDGTVPHLHLCLKNRKERGNERNNYIKVNELIQRNDIWGYQGGIKIKDFCDVTPYGLLIDYKRLGGSLCIHIQDIVFYPEDADWILLRNLNISTKLRNVTPQKIPVLKETSTIGR